MRKRFLLLAIAGLVAGAAVAQGSASNAYDEARRSLVTSAKHAPSPQDFDNKVPKGVEVVHYRSAPGDLMAWVMRPKADASKEPRPVVVYAHGGFALGEGDDVDARAFVDAGFIVMLPAVRGENGNPGNFELFLGEVDDVIAAGVYAKTLPGADSKRVYLFGHSIGGGLANLVNLSAANPYALVGSTGGNYTLEDCSGIASQWGTFKASITAECEARFPDPYLAAMKSPLYAYVGEKDKYARAVGAIFRSAGSSNYHLTVLPGDHFSAVEPSIKAFIAQIGK